MKLTFFRKVLLLFIATLAFAGVNTTHAQVVAAPPNPAEAIKQGDLADAARQARRLAETGDPDGQFMLALFFWHGVALPQSYQDALNWITLSAVSGHPRAPAARIEMLKATEPPLPQRSMEWTRANLTQRAEAGDNQALFHLAASYSQRFGFQNTLEAYFWYNLSVASGNVAARKQRNIVIAGLKQGDIIKAQERAKEWVEKWRGDNAQSSPAREPTEQEIISNKEQFGSSLETVKSENEQDGEHNAPDLSMQGGSVDQR